MQHENYKGYDAIAGKPHVEHEPSPGLMEHIGDLAASDLPAGVPPEWLQPLRRVKNLCERKHWRFAISPFEYQVAKISCEEFVIVLWSSRRKKSRARYIRPACEGHCEPVASSAALYDLTIALQGKDT